MKFSLLSKIFNPPSRLLPNETKYLSKSQKLLLYYGLISPSTCGTYTIMPILQRSLDKLINIINDEMMNIGAEKLTMPSLGRSAIWKTSGRWSEMGNDLFKLSDKDLNELCLQPTHEEEITNLLSIYSPLKSSSLPILLYQITSKFRNEISPRSGLLRCREFLMKDLYSFDDSIDAAGQTYDRVVHQYHRIFEQLDVNFLCAEAHCGDMGGSRSNEFHILSPAGEDTVITCNKCDKVFNKELQTKITDHLCSDPSCDGTLSFHNAIEIGHCFLLGNRYSNAFNLHYVDNKSVKKSVSMGCFGIGVTRLLAACIESLSDTDKIRWPQKIVPYRVAILLQKGGAHDYPPEELKLALLNSLAHNFTLRSWCHSDILIDDSNVTIGKKLTNCDALGIPWAIVVKDKKIFETVNLYQNKTSHLPLMEAVGLVSGEHDCFVRNVGISKIAK